MRGTPPDYDTGNTFARILRGELPVERVYESQHALAFRDAQPQARHHVQVIPKGHYASLSGFVSQAPLAQVRGLLETVVRAAERLGLHQTGYRVLVDESAHDAVPHLSLHLLGGQDLGDPYPGAQQALPARPEARTPDREQAGSYPDDEALARMLRGELPAASVAESDNASALRHPRPLAPVHLLIGPRGRYASLGAFLECATEDELAGLCRALAQALETRELRQEGLRLILDQGPDAHQTVPHLCFQLLGGTDLAAPFPEETRAHTGAVQSGHTASSRPESEGGRRDVRRPRRRRGHDMGPAPDGTLG